MNLLLALIPFVNPLPFPAWARLWMFLPLAACVALVYRATRARTTEGLARRTVFTFFNIVFGMVGIALGAYALHATVLHFSA